ncbi:MAG: glycosyltransferase family 2 protein [Ignavibacteriales bacterium]
MKLSVVVPCYNEEEMIPIFYEEVTKELKKLKIDYELVFIDDGSVDKTLPILKKLYNSHKNIKVISFSRNFGKESAMLAALEKTVGDYVVIMDADLQTPPKLLKEMITTLETEDYDCVAAYRNTRTGEPIIKSLFSKLFYKLINTMTDIKMAHGASDFRMMKRSVVNSLLQLKEYYRFTKGFFSWIGYNTKYIEYENVERVAGKTKWNFLGLFKYAIEGIVSFTTVPLRLATIFGTLVSLAAFIYTIYIIINTLIYGNDVSGWASIMCIILFMGGLQLLALGIIGEYLGRTYYEVKRRPAYIIKDYMKYDK